VPKLLQREQFSQAKTDERAAQAVERDLKSAKTVESLQRSRRQMAQGQGRNWRDVYPPK
jgi:hypothetical protein